jgi:hypothetical protein
MVPPIRILGEYDTFTSRIASSVSGYRCHTWRSCAKAILTPGVATAQDAAGTGWRRQNRRDSRFRRNRLSADIQCAGSVCRRDGAANDWAGSDPIFCGLIRWGPAIRTFCIFDGAAGWEILPNRTYALLAGSGLQFAKNYLRGLDLNVWLAERDPQFTLTSPAPNVIDIADSANAGKKMEFTLDPATFLPVKNSVISISDTGGFCGASVKVISGSNGAGFLLDMACDLSQPDSGGPWQILSLTNGKISPLGKPFSTAGQMGDFVPGEIKKIGNLTQISPDELRIRLFYWVFLRFRGPSGGLVGGRTRFGTALFLSNRSRPYARRVRNACGRRRTPTQWTGTDVRAHVQRVERLSRNTRAPCRQERFTSRNSRQQGLRDLGRIKDWNRSRRWP